MEQINIPFSGLQNTLDAALVGKGCFSMDNATVERGVIESAKGYTLQIAELGATGHGLGFGRYEGTEEFIAVVGSSALIASPTATAWTVLASTVAESAWYFAQFGNRMYCVNETDGLVEHTIGDTDWGSAAPAAPASGDTLYPVEGWTNFTESASGWWNIAASADIASGWDIDQTTGNVSPDPTYDKLIQKMWLFDLNRNYFGAPDGLRFTFTFDSVQDFTDLDMWVFQSAIFSNNLDSYFIDQSFVFYFETSSGTTIDPTGVGTMQDILINGATDGKFLMNYFAGVDLSDVKKMHFELVFHAQRGIGSNAQIGITLWRGETAMNESYSFDLDAGAKQDKIKYRYTVTESGLESNMSVETVESPTVHSNEFMQSNFMRVGVDTVATSASGDVLKFYRRISATGAYAYIGSGLNTGTPFKPDDYTGTLFVDDKYQEWELGDLPAFAGRVIDTTDNPGAIGVFRASLGLGVQKDLYLSKVDRPAEFEDINAAPDPDDFNQGRSLYLDATRSENVNGIFGGNVLYCTTKNRVYVMIGDFPKDLTPPVAITNNGPIGGHSAALFQNGLVFLDQQGLWFITYSDDANVAGNVIAQELTAQVASSITILSPSSSSVVVVHQGDLYCFDGPRYLRLERKAGIFESGTLNHDVVAAVADYENNLRMLTASGGLIKYDDGQDYNGSSISWTWGTGDIISDRGRITRIQVIAEGTPTVQVTSKDGSYGSVTKSYLLDGKRSIYPLDVSRMVGSQFSLQITGDENDKLIGLSLETEDLGGGRAR